MRGKYTDDRQRNYGIDALRIFAMYMIIIIHLLGKGEVLNSEYSSVAIVVDTFLYSLVLCCVNCYALISGYVGYNRNTKYNFGSYINLWLQVVFYGIVILVIVKFSDFAVWNSASGTSREAPVFPGTLSRKS